MSNDELQIIDIVVYFFWGGEGHHNTDEVTSLIANFNLSKNIIYCLLKVINNCAVRTEYQTIVLFTFKLN